MAGIYLRQLCSLLVFDARWALLRRALISPGPGRRWINEVRPRRRLKSCSGQGEVPPGPPRTQVKAASISKSRALPGVPQAGGTYPGYLASRAQSKGHGKVRCQPRCCPSSTGLWPGDICMLAILYLSNQFLG